MSISRALSVAGPINTLSLQEAHDSSEIENIVTTHNELFKGDVLPDAFANPAAKEVLRYRQALRVGCEQTSPSGGADKNKKAVAATITSTAL